MDKQKYYVSVQSKTIMAHQGDAPYEFEIMATPEELQELESLFGEMEDFDENTFFRAHSPGIPYHQDSDNDDFDYSLKQIYGFIERHGTEETRHHLASMDLDLGRP
jgi:hypothetical protein